MSFIITLYVPEGIVMASDSRQTVLVEREGLPPVPTVASDFTYKTFFLEQHSVGISVCGDDLLGGVQMQSHIKRLEEEGLSRGDAVDKVVDKLMPYFREKFPQADTRFHIAGFKKEGEATTPHVYVCHIERNEKDRVNFDTSTKRIQYGCAWGGEIDTISTILKTHQILGPDDQPISASHYDISFESMNLQDAIDFAIYAVRTTIDTMRFQARPKTVGGPIDVLLLTPEQAGWIKKKALHASEG